MAVQEPSNGRATPDPLSRRAGYWLALSILMLIASIFLATPARVVPSFADQTGQPCQSCHVGGFGPQLKPFGRDFKLHGYTARAGKKFSVPLAAMAIGSFTKTAKAQADPPADHFSRNNNFALDQFSIFLAGGLGSHVGGFAQITYDGVGRAWAWDNLDIRAVNTGTIAGTDIVYGLSLNNSPGVQDVWNTLPAWGYPYTDSALAPSPGTAPLISGGLAQEVLGLTAYTWIDSRFYIEGGGYRTPTAGTLHWLGADPLAPGEIDGIAPYARIAVQQQIGGGTGEFGAFLLKAAIWPGRDHSSGRTDHYTDTGIDGSWIRTLGSNNTLTFNARYTHEHFALEGTCALGLADGSIVAPSLSECARGHLDEVRGDASYYWHDKIGVTISGFDIHGSRNPSLYTNNRTVRPDSSGVTFQIDGTPFGDGKSPLGPLFNLRVGAQYTTYIRFDGARRNFDSTGRNASDNNTLRVFTWIAF